ncbi:hypothetical protein [Roseimaritima sediminicola]|uniref:hypothetical protein n=1 Tax=Roseimaritima sediminicola TaxID=2662066 RepID=UPI00129837BD|nr:hypothetical protein [Roseimaritima sediminicola]
MSEPDAIHKRGRALEDEFFHRVDEELQEKIRLAVQREQPKAMLREATGFQDDELLDQLLDAGINVEKLAALALVPAVSVAWADGKVTPDERRAVLQAAGADGLKKDSVAFHLVESWLQQEPSPSLWQLWEEYAEALTADMSESTKKTLTDEVIRQATVVAKASGGTLGFGSVSAKEQAVLNKAQRTLQ